MNWHDDPADLKRFEANQLFHEAYEAQQANDYDRAIELGQQAIIAAELAGVADGRPTRSEYVSCTNGSRGSCGSRAIRLPHTPRSRLQIA